MRFAVARWRRIGVRPEHNADVSVLSSDRDSVKQDVFVKRVIRAKAGLGLGVGLKFLRTRS